MCLDLLQDPLDFAAVIGRTTTSLSTSMKCGFRCPSRDSAVMKRLFNNAHGFFSLVDKSKLLDWYPSLRKIFRVLPIQLNSVAIAAKRIYEAERQLFYELYDDVQLSVVKGIERPCKSRNTRSRLGGELSDSD